MEATTRRANQQEPIVLETDLPAPLLDPAKGCELHSKASKELLTELDEMKTR